MKILPFLIVITLSHSVFAVDINTASAAELARELSDIGLVKAQSIVEYRQKIGGFVSLKQLTEIKGIGPKILARNRNKLSISALPNTTAAKPKPHWGNHKELPPHVDNSPKFQKPHGHSVLWDALIIIPLFIVCLFIFIVAWLKNTIKDKAVPRKYLLSTTFVCTGCGKVSSFQNVPYKGHFGSQYIDGDLPPGWSCIPNWLGKPCDYCFDCSP